MAQEQHEDVANENRKAAESILRPERDGDSQLEEAWQELARGDVFSGMMRYGRNPSMLRTILWQAFKLGFVAGKAAQ